MPNDNDGRRGGWQLDKRVPVAVILALIGQAMGILIWIGGQTAELRDHERRLAQVEIAVNGMGKSLSDLARDAAHTSAQVDILVEDRHRAFAP